MGQQALGRFGHQLARWARDNHSLPVPLLAVHSSSCARLDEGHACPTPAELQQSLSLAGNANRDERNAQTAGQASQTRCPASMLEPWVLRAVSVPRPRLLSASHKLFTTSKYSGEVNWQLPSSTGKRGQIAKLTLQTQPEPDWILHPAWSCAISCK